MATFWGEDINELKNFLMIVLSSLSVFIFWIIIRLRNRADLKPSLDGKPNEFTWTTIFLCLWYYSGLVLDGWAHTNGVVDESFFTKWHAMFYSGFIAFAGFTVWTLWRIYDNSIPTNFSSLTKFLKGMPKGYGFATAGMLIFGLAGIGDMIWHILFGLEGGLDILLSPTHIMLAAGMFLAILAPFWSAWHHSHNDENTFKGQLAPIVSLSISMSVLTFFTRFAHPFNLKLSEICQGHGNPLSNGALNCPSSLRIHGGTTSVVYDQAGLQLGIISMMFQSFLIVGIILLFVKRWNPAKGSLFTLILLNGIAISFQVPGDLKIVPIRIFIFALMGIICEILVLKFNPKLEGLKLRVFSFLLPFLYMIIWWMTITLENQNQFNSLINLNQGIIYPLGWSVHATLGGFFLAGCSGLFTSMLVSPPKIDTLKEVMPSR